MKIFAERLKELRTANNLSQSKVARLLGISTTCYAGYEQGYREPDYIIFIEICEFFDVSADYLLGLKD